VKESELGREDLQVATVWIPDIDSLVQRALSVYILMTSRVSNLVSSNELIFSGKLFPSLILFPLITKFPEKRLLCRETFSR
jgi:hypothetical protein